MSVEAAPWIGEYPLGVPPRVDPLYPSLAGLIEQACERYRNRCAYTALGVDLGYDELDRLSQDFASYLQNVLGLERGDRVAIMLPNLLQYPVVLCAVLRAGLVVVNVNPLYTPRELEHQLRDSGARAIVILENFCSVLQEVVERTALEQVITTQVGDLAPFPRSLLINLAVKRLKKQVPPWKIEGSLPLRTALARGKAQPYHRVAVEAGDTAFLQYTGGTTGLSKGAQLTHGNIVANLSQMLAWLRPALGSGGPDEPQELIVTALPLYHVFALTVNGFVFLALGARNLLIPNPRDLPALVRELREYPFTAFTGVNTLFNGLLNTPGFAELDFSSLKFTVGGGAAVLQATAERWKAVTGVPITEGYGLTETSPGVCFAPLDKPDWNGTIGVPLPSTDVRLRDEANREVADGDPGELCVKGPQVMVGYWRQPEETAKVFTADGYLRTGDIATRDARGYFRIVDRKKDMILVSGFNVFPNEIEAVAALHPGVLECACIGVPDAKTGEAVKLVAVKKDPALTVEALREHCRAQLTAYKVPKLIEFRDTLPKSNIGKILRRELR
ncbi:MAG TPA: AMP-binding protein [Nevskiaceae bacterium]|nr:AMP-binding protein [Nevskiaceae bacterium]